MKSLRLLLLATLAGSAGLFAGDQDLTAGLNQMATDGRGRIFAFGRLWKDKLAVFEYDRWSELPIFPAGSKPAEPRGLLRLHDGRLASVWNTGKTEWVLAILDDKQITQSIPFSWHLGSYDFFSMAQDSTGRIWLSGGTPEVVRFDPSAGTFHTFDLAALYTGEPKEKWCDVFLTEDLRGGLWLWTSYRGDKSVSLPGPVRIQGDALNLLADIPGLTARTVDCLLPRDKDSLWMDARHDGLFVFNLETLSAEPVPEPQASAFRFSFHGIFPFGKGFLVLSGYKSGFSLWQFADGKWTRRTTPDSVPLMMTDGRAPAYLDAKSGALIATADDILYVPHDGEGTKLLDWHSGWILTRPAQFLSLGGDRFAALSSGGDTRWAVADLNDLLAPRPQSDATEFLPWCGWAVDSQDRIFTLLKPKSAVLDVWENGSWREIPLPKDRRNDLPTEIEIDSQSRIWVVCFLDKLPVGILSSDLNTWETEPDYLSALAKHCEDFGGFANVQSRLRPIAGPHGQIAFRTTNWQIIHWDRTSWKTWDLFDIGPFAKNDRVSTPFFDDGGRLCVNTLRSNKTWKLGDDQKWTGETKVPGIPDSEMGDAQSPERQELPKDFTPQDIRYPKIATDNLGLTWVAGNSNLYKYYKGRTVAIFGGKEVHPFLKNPAIRSVRVDRFGNTWFQTGSINHVMLPARKISPPSVSLKTDRWGALSLEKSVAGIVEWRADGGDWRELLRGEKSLGVFPSGTHDVEFRILDDRLDLVGPIKKTVNISIKPEEQIEHFITILRAGPDAMREIAVKGLAGQPSLAIPALKSAIASADSWWLQAALQECERESLKPVPFP